MSFRFEKERYDDLSKTNIRVNLAISNYPKGGLFSPFRRAFTRCTIRNFNNYVLQKGQHYFTVKKNKPRSHGTRLVCYFNILCYSFSVVSVCGSAITTAFFLMYGNTAKVTHVTIPAANTTSIATQRATNNGDFASALTLTVVAVT